MDRVRLQLLCISTVFGGKLMFSTSTPTEAVGHKSDGMTSDRYVQKQLSAEHTQRPPDRYTNQHVRSDGAGSQLKGLRQHCPRGKPANFDKRRRYMHAYI